MVRAMNEQFGVGTVMGTGFRVWAKNIVPFTLITALIYVPIFVWGTITISSDPGGSEILKMLAYAAGITALLNVFVTATITYGVVMELQGKRAGIGACIAVGFKRLFPAIGVALLSVIAMAGGFILLIVPGVIVACMLYVAMPVFKVVERPGVMGALKRSSELTKGHKGQIFGILFLLWLIGWAAGKIQGSVLEPHTLADVKISLYISLGIQVILGSLGAVISAVAYYYLRNEKEGTSASELAAVFE